MPVLSNPRHERFAQELAKGKTATEAYELAGYKPSRPNASHLQQQHNISHRLGELLAERHQLHAIASEKAADRLSIDKAWVLRCLIEDRTQAKEQGQVAPAIRALELVGKELGMFIDRKEVGEPGAFDDMTDPDELRRKLIARAEELGQRDIAAALAGGEEETGGPRRAH